MYGNIVSIFICVDVHKRLICNSEKLETHQMSINIIYYSETKRNGLLIPFNNMGEYHNSYAECYYLYFKNL